MNNNTTIQVYTKVSILLVQCWYAVLCGLHEYIMINNKSNC